MKNFEKGNVVFKLPLPPNAMTTVYQNDYLFFEKYLKRHPGYFDCGDGGYFDENGNLYILGRSNDLIKMSKFDVYGGEVELEILKHPKVKEVIIIER